MPPAICLSSTDAIAQTVKYATPLPYCLEYGFLRLANRLFPLSCTLFHSSTLLIHRLIISISNIISSCISCCWRLAYTHPHIPQSSLQLISRFASNLLTTPLDNTRPTHLIKRTSQTVPPRTSNRHAFIRLHGRRSGYDTPSRTCRTSTGDNRQHSSKPLCPVAGQPLRCYWKHPVRTWTRRQWRDGPDQPVKLAQQWWSLL